MVGEQLCAVLGPVAGQPLEPLGRPSVPIGPRRPGELRIGDVADQHVPEGVLALPVHLAAALAAQELLALQGVQPLLEHRLLLGGQGVQAGRDDSLDALGERQLLHRFEPPAPSDPLEVAAVVEHPHVLLGVQRVAA